MRLLLLSAALGASLFAAPALAGEGCSCGDEGCEQACTCSAGVCPLHRPGKATTPKTTSPQAAGPAQKAAPAPAPAPASSPGGTSAARAPAAR